MRARTMLVGVVVAATGSTAYAAPPGTVWAEGRVAMYHDICESLGEGDLRLSMHSASTASPTDGWTAKVWARSVTGCEAHAAGVCRGDGTLAEGVTFTDCVGDVDGGTFGPVVVCYPGPARPRPLVVTHAPITIDGVDGTFDGDVKTILAGSAVDEAQNICV